MVLGYLSETGRIFSGEKSRSFGTGKIQPSPKYHTKGCSRSSVDSPGARTLVFAAFEPFSSCEFRASIARTPFCAILWRSPKNRVPKDPSQNPSQNPSFRVRCGELCSDPQRKRASHERTQGDPGCPEHCPQWFCDCASIECCFAPPSCR